MHCVEVGLEDPQAKKMTKPPVTASAVAEAETVDAKPQSENNAYVGRFDGSNSKHASPAMAAAAGKLQENEDLTALPTSTKWSVLSSRVEGLVAELSQVVGNMDAYCVAKSNAEGPAMVAVRNKMVSTPWAEEWNAKRTMFSYGE